MAFVLFSPEDFLPHKLVWWIWNETEGGSNSGFTSWEVVKRWEGEKTIKHFNHFLEKNHLRLQCCCCWFNFYLKGLLGLLKRGGGEQGERENFRQSPHPGGRRHAGLNLTTPRSWSEPRSRVGCSVSWATQVAEDILTEDQLHVWCKDA